MITIPEIPSEVQRLMDERVMIERDLDIQTKLKDESALDKFNADQMITNLEQDYNNNYLYHFTYEVEVETVDGKPDGKKKFTNQKLRDIEVARRLAADEGAKELREKIKEAKEAQFKANRANFQCREEIQKLIRRHSGVVGDIHLYAELIHAGGCNGNQRSAN